MLTGFVNSAPPRFTTNGKACGGSLKPGMEVAYAQYLAGVVRTLHDRDHITLQFVSPMNEPDDSFADCGQEGMQVPVVAARRRGAGARSRAGARHAPYAKVIADETTADAILSTEAPTVARGAGCVARTSRRSRITPTTSPPTRCASSCRRSPARFGVPTWMTEICCYKGSGGVASSFGAHYDPTMTQGFWLADQIDADLTVAGDSAWYWWTALSPVLGCDPKADPECPTRVNTKGFNDGLLYYDQHGPARRRHEDLHDQTLLRARPVQPLRAAGRRAPRRVGPAGRAARDGVRRRARQWTIVTWNESKRRRHVRSRPSRCRDAPRPAP